jgi:hypothetical protein
MNAPELSLAQIAFSGAFRPAVLPGGSGNEEPRSGRGGSVLVPCVLLSIALHAVLLLGLEFRQIEREADRTLLLDIVAPAVKEPAPQVPQASRVVPEPGSVRTSPEPTPPARKAASRPARPRQTEKKEKVGPSQKVAQRPSPEKAPASRGPGGGDVAAVPLERRVPVGQVAKRPGATVLANESGQDALKHGAEARFMHGVATEEFVEENYVGEYTLGDDGRVWIEDDRSRSGHLILHAEAMGLHRKLFRFNRFIYVYGDSPDSASPILGSVTFFSDGYHIHQFLWQHNSTKAFFPRRNE